MDVYFLSKFKKEKGFTLVELLVIVTVVAVLIGLSVRSYTFINNRAKETATETEMSNIAKALEIYVMDYSTYPESADFPAALEVAGIMEGAPELDTWESFYQYSSTAGSSYTLESYGINKADGGDDDIVFTNGVMTEDGLYPNQ